MRGRIFWVLGVSCASILLCLLYYLHGTHDSRLRQPQSSPINTEALLDKSQLPVKPVDETLNLPNNLGTPNPKLPDAQDYPQKNTEEETTLSNHIQVNSDNQESQPDSNSVIANQDVSFEEQHEVLANVENEAQNNLLFNPDPVARDPSQFNIDFKYPTHGQHGIDIDSESKHKPESQLVTEKVPADHQFPKQSLEQEALNKLRRQMEIERKEVDKWKKEQQQDIAEEKRKIQEAQHSLLEEKIRFQKEVGEMMEEIKNGVIRGDVANLIHTLPASTEVLPPHQDPPDTEHTAGSSSDYWLGLNFTYIKQMYPQIQLNPQYKLQSFFAPHDPMAAGMQGNPKSMNDLTAGQAEERFYQLISETHMSCENIQRLGNLGDGGWDICVAAPYGLHPGCIVYSFGINFDFSFDDSVANTYGCEVRSFDPSMNTGDHVHSKQVYFYQLGLGAANTVNSLGWRLQTMGNIMKKLNHLQTPIDVLKLDIEHNEWDCFHTMLKEGVLRNVKQLIFEMHTPEVYTVRRPSTKEDFIRMASILRGLEEQGFRRYHFHYNPFGIYTSTRTGKSRTCCYELYYVNVHYLR